ncbi:MAG: hypothetical protein K9I29_00440 [Bacteroidales bacterium]|nr:hypothetical protein [Bacteroidales bacterium]MCF8326733.1 hypothetical protein [Bacteroidales bacterium]
MRKIISLILMLMFFYLVGYGQEAMTIKEGREKGYSVSALDKKYVDAVNVNPDSALFNDNSGEFIQSWQTMLQDLGSYLQDHDFVWKKQTRCFNKVYFDKDGNIDYFLYNLNPQLDETQAEKFRMLLQDFIENYQLPVQGEKKFTQCGPSMYMPTNKKSGD